MSTLPFISDKNLISARRYGIELDIEDSCARLAASAMQAQPGRREPVSEAELQAQAHVYRAILLHLWPEPEDPVVNGLRTSARLAMAHIEILLSRYRPR